MALKFGVRAAAIAVIGTFAMAVAGPTSKAVPDKGDRQLSLYNIHTKQRLDVVYKRNGRFVPGALKKLNRFARDWRRNETTRMDKRLFDLLWELHTELGSRKPIHLISGYRSPKTNAMLRKKRGGQARKSRHMLGMAMDVHFPDVPVKRLRYSALVRQIGGVGYYPTSAIPFIHVDTGRVRHWPRMPRYELALLFPNGKTKHRPRSGGAITRRDASIARRKYAKLAREVAAFHDLRKGGGNRTLLASLSPPKPKFMRDGGLPVATQRPAKVEPPRARIASIDPRLVLKARPRPALRPAAFGTSDQTARDPLNDLLRRNPAETRRLPDEARPGLRRDLNRERKLETQKPERQIALPLPRPKRPAEKPAGYFAAARAALSSKIEGLLELAGLSEKATDSKTHAANKLNKQPTKRARVAMPVQRSGLSDNWAEAPDFDDEHPDELSYRPFPIAPLLTVEYQSAPMFSAMVHPDQSRLFDWLDMNETRMQMAFRPGLKYAEMLYDHQFKGDAVTLPTFQRPQRNGRPVRTARGN